MILLQKPTCLLFPASRSWPPEVHHRSFCSTPFKEALFNECDHVLDICRKHLLAQQYYNVGCSALPSMKADGC